VAIRASSTLRTARLLTLLDFTPGAVADTVGAAHPGADGRALAARALVEKRTFDAGLAAAVHASRCAAIEAEHDLGASMHTPAPARV